MRSRPATLASTTTGSSASASRAPSTSNWHRADFEKRESGAADVLIHMHARIDQRIESDAIDREYARCDVSDCRPFVYEAGTLLLDFIDTRTNQLAWRGWAEGGFDGAIDNQDWMEARIDDAVAKILARLPRDTSRKPLTEVA